MVGFSPGVFLSAGFYFAQEFNGEILDSWINFDSIFVSCDLNQRNRRKKILFSMNVYRFERILEKKCSKSERKTGICNATNTEPH